MIFVDTWAWIALCDKSDQHHSQAVTQHRKLQKARRKYVTSDFVLSELITYLYDALPAVKAQAFVESIFVAAEAGRYLLLHISPSQFRQAWKMRQKYHDKPDISFVDFTSMVVMQDEGITEIFTGDAHFRQVGLGFQLLP
jgi:predicted nucleic acid-binding protein